MSVRTFLGPYIVGLALLAGILGLLGCSHGPQQVRVETIETKVPVAVQPIKPSDIPTPPPPLGPRPPTAQQAADAAFAGWCAAVAYIVRSVPLLSVSAGLPAAQAPRYPECEGTKP